MTPQVDQNYYFKEKYACLERFISYFYQIDLIRKSNAKKILFIGIGDAMVSDYLKKNNALSITTFDFDQSLLPDTIGDVRELKFPDNHFDLVVAYEVLEHIPLADFETALSELARVSNKQVIISLPFRQTSFEIVLKFPYIRSLFKKNYFRILWSIPIKFPGIEVSTQHYWEISTKPKLKKIRAKISKYFSIKDEEKALLDPYRYFFVLEKSDSPLSHEYVKDYYNNYLNDNYEEYEYSRWHSSPEREFDYQQTKHVIEQFLEGRKFNSTLEVGPGDGVWTEMIIPHTAELQLVEQSEEMFNRAQNRLKNYENISIINTDFLKYEDPSKKYEFIFSSRCFEYIIQKTEALLKMSQLLVKDGLLVIITKNPKYFSPKGKNSKKLHTEQISRHDMCLLLEKSGFELIKTTPAVLRWKSKYSIFRVFYSNLHRLFTRFGQANLVDKIFTYSTESYIYIAKKK